MTRTVRKTSARRKFHWTLFDYRIFPTCGLATTTELVGVVDDPRYFAYPERINRGVLWFAKGYIEYIIPNVLPTGTRVDQITLSLEMSSEAPGVNSDWPSIFRSGSTM